MRAQKHQEKKQKNDFEKTHSPGSKSRENEHTRRTNTRRQTHQKDIMRTQEFQKKTHHEKPTAPG